MGPARRFGANHARPGRPIALFWNLGGWISVFAMPGRMTQDTAETIALTALGHLAGAEEDFDRFLTTSGLDAASLKARAGEPEVLAAVLDFLLRNEALLIDFCDSASIAARDVHMAHHLLGGA
jgi:hypothetical protein